MPGKVAGLVSVTAVSWFSSGLNQLRQPEIQHFNPSVTSDKHVLRFQIPVHDSLLVCGRESLRNAERVFDRAPQRQRPRYELLPQCLSFKKFADQKRRTVVHTNVMDSQDVRMVQRRNRARFLFETPQPVGIMRQRFWQHFDRDITPEPRVACPVHLAHAARSYRRYDLVRPEFGARGKRHRCAQL